MRANFETCTYEKAAIKARMSYRPIWSSEMQIELKHSFNAITIRPNVTPT